MPHSSYARLSSPRRRGSRKKLISKLDPRLRGDDKRGAEPVSDKAAEQAIAKLITWLGDDPTRPDLLKTPQRVAARLRKLFCGYQTNLDELLEFDSIEADQATTHERAKSAGPNSTISLSNIEFISFCEHHMLPMVGTVSISYIPNQKLIGIGRVARIVRAITRRLQIQERITNGIAEALQACLKPRGVTVIVRARHYCLDAEEDGASSAVMETRCSLGEIEKLK